MGLSNDLAILGTIMTKGLTTGTVNAAVVDLLHGATATTRDKGGLMITAYRIVMGPSGKIDTSGDDATVANDRGVDGGDVCLYADYGGAFFFGTDSMDASGGSGATGGTPVNGIIWIDWVDVTPTDGTLP